jgi:EAL domain-containing protein (putative c-di-GMP-specific phosphodiesterase class I)/GGDEF domain-containing protein
MTTAPNKADLLGSLIRDRAVRPMFQPIVDLNDGMIIAYEALCRPLPDRGFSNADELFGTADELGMLWELETVTRSIALAAAADWPRDVRLFLNNSPSVFADDRFADMLRESLAGFGGVTSNQIVLEITERSGSDFDDKLLRQVSLAKESGFNIAVDDAGAGTSGLNRMMQIRPHWIKLDRQLIADINLDPLKQNLVRSFVHFARMSGVSVIAEGIETAPELASLMGQGIRFGQGYFLARPGERATTLDVRTFAKVRERWASVEASVPAEPHAMPMVRLCTGVLVVESGSMSVADVAVQLGKNLEHPGAVITEGRRLIGWADRRTIATASMGAQAHDPISSLVTTTTSALTPDATVREALQFACTREEGELGHPLVIAAGPEIVGIVPMRDLLRVAASESRPARRLVPAPVGLPVRIRSEQQLHAMIARGQDPAQRLGNDYHADAAFIDVRRFIEYNSVFGYAMGDRVIRVLTEQLQTCLVRNASDVFMAHIGEDRFLVTARAGLLDARIKLLVQTFEQSSPALTDPALASDPQSAANASDRRGRKLGLRVLLLPDIFQRVSHPREIFRVEQQLRQKARGQEALLAEGQSLIVSDERGGDPRSVRLSA